MEDYGRLILDNGLLSEYPDLLKNPDFLRLAAEFFPQRFNWLLFSAGELLLLVGIYLQHRGGLRLSSGFTAMPPLAREQNREQG